MRPEIFIARRLSLGHGQRTPLGIKIGVAGVALSFIIMLLAVSIVVGFKNEIRRKVLGFEAPITLTPRQSIYSNTERDAALKVDNEFKAIVSASLPNARIAPVNVLQTMLKTDETFNALLIKCVDKNYDRDFISESIVEGEWPDDTIGTNGIVVSRSTANSLGLALGQKVFAHFLVDGNLKTRRLSVKAIYDTNFEDYDKVWAFADSELARSVLHAPENEFNQIELTGIPRDEINDAAITLADAFVTDALERQSNLETVPVVDTALQHGAIYFNWLDLLDTNVVVIITLMFLVSGFTLISSLFILILQRVSMIGMLKSIGATNGQIRRIFIYLAQKIVIKGLIWGNIVGVAAIVAQHYLKFIPLDPESYYLSYVPTDLNFGWWIALNISTLVVSFVTLLGPSMIISKMSPTASLRYTT